MKTKAIIQQELSAAFTAVADHLRAYDAAQFEATPDGKWSGGQQLDHLIRAVRPLNLAFGLPRFIFRFWGKPNRPSRSFEALVQRYKDKLAAGGRASGPFIPPVISFGQKEELVKKYQQAGEKLVKQLDRWSEQQLDSYLLPHPLLGKISVREMMYFTIYHNQHHLQQLVERNNQMQ
jgi:DinB superfamily